MSPVAVVQTNSFDRSNYNLISQTQANMNEGNAVCCAFLRSILIRACFPFLSAQKFRPQKTRSEQSMKIYEIFASKSEKKKQAHDSPNQINWFGLASFYYVVSFALSAMFPLRPM